MRHAVLAVKDAAGAVTHAVARGIADGQLGGLDHHLHHPARPAAVFPRSAGIGSKFMTAEEQREAHLGHLETAEFDPAGRLPFSGTGPAVPRRRGAAARPRLEEMPDEGFPPGTIGAR